MRIVSPDPIGPLAERWTAWTAFRSFADEHGWTVAVMGAGEAWLPIYRASGMHDLYVGDEGLVDVRRFTLDGGTPTTAMIMATLHRSDGIWKLQASGQGLKARLPGKAAKLAVPFLPQS